MRAMLAWEQGAGFGHIAFFNQIAPHLAARGVELIGAWGPLRNIERAHSAIKQIIPAPFWAGNSGKWSDQLVDVERRIDSFANVLDAMGFGDERLLVNNQRAWTGILELLRPDVIVADYAPGVVLAAREMTPVLQRGSWYTIPAQRDGYFAPYDGEEFRDAEAQDKLLATINAVLSKRGTATLARLGDLHPAETSFAIGFPEFDGHSAWRARPLYRQKFPRVLRPAQRGDCILAYIDASLLSNEVLCAALLRLPARVRLSATGVSAPIAEALSAHGLIIENEPFSVETIARDARLFLHHGGAGAAHLGAIAGVPQLILYADVEKRSHARSVEKLGVGRGIDLARLSVPKLREEVEFLLDSQAFASRARDLALELEQCAPQTNIYEEFAERAFAAGAGSR